MTNMAQDHPNEKPGVFGGCEMSEPDDRRRLIELGERIFERVISDPQYAQHPQFDTGMDRAYGVLVRDVVDLIGDLDLFEVRQMLNLLSERKAESR
jgi:hypothetical protein